MALVVAQRYGLPQEVIERAKQYLPAGFKEYFSARESLESYIREYEEKLRELKEEKERLENLVLEQERLKAHLEREKREEIRRAVEEIRDRFEEFMAEAEKSLRSVKDRQRLRELFRERFRDVLEEVVEDIREGDWVELLGSKGKVLEVKEDRVKVQFGSVSAWVRKEELKKTQQPIVLEERGVEKLFDLRKGSVSEINLTGLTVEEALTKLELFLQEAHSMGLKSVKVIHGHGVLKRAVQDFLSSSSLVVFHREGYPKEGGSGTSLVYLRRD
jgi:DNA mismatch repair protein MutS2